MRRRDFLGALGAGLAGPLAALAGRARRTASGESVFVERWSWAMGQPVHLQLFAASEAAGYEVAQAALGELRRVEGALSRFDEASDLSELNRAAGRGPQRDRAGPRAVLDAARRFRTLTDGAFDPAIEPLMRAWGFHARRTRRRPRPSWRRRARRCVRPA